MMVKKGLIQYTTILDVSKHDCPKDVKGEVREMWADYEARNGDYIPFDVKENLEEGSYPAISKFLESVGVSDCLIHWWW